MRAAFSISSNLCPAQLGCTSPEQTLAPGSGDKLCTMGYKQMTRAQARTQHTMHTLSQAPGPNEACSSTVNISAGAQQPQRSALQQRQAGRQKHDL